MTREQYQIESRAQWLQWRQGDLTASSIAALFDCHPYMIPDQLVGLKRGTWHAGDNAAMRRGRILEPAVIEALKEDYPDWRLERATTYHRLPDYRIGCTPDCWLGEDELVQIKTAAPEEWTRWGGRPPLAYSLQVLTELLVTDKKHGYLAVMVCNRSYPVHVYPVPRHPAAEMRILTAAAEWWQKFDAGELAAPVDPAAIAADLDDGSHKDLSTDNELPVLLAERENLQIRSKVDSDRLDEINDTIKQRIGSARTAYVPGWNLSYANQHRKQTVIPARDYRVLRVKPITEEVIPHGQ